MYARSLAVVALCTVFVIAFYLVVSYETAGIGDQTVTIPTAATGCSESATSCDIITITSATLHTVNYTDELGTVNYATLSLAFKPTGGSVISSLQLFIGNMSAGSIQGPFPPGSIRMENVTLPATISISPGNSYILSLKGSYGASQTVWTSTMVTAE